MNPHVVVIIINYNQNAYTLKCIDSLLASRYQYFDILLIDNGSTEENYSLLIMEVPKDSRIILKRISQNIGYVAATNYGLEEGLKLNAEYFLIMNNDTIIDQYAIMELVNTCNKYDNKAIVTGKVYHYDDPNRLQDVGYMFKNKNLLTIIRIGENEIDTGQYDKVENRDLLDDIYWLFPSILLKNIGGYSPYFWFNYEQEDFALRAKYAGYQLIYTPAAKIWHKGSVSIGGRDLNPNRAYWTVQSSLILKFIHLKKIYFIKFYFITINSIIRTFFKSFIFRSTDQKDISRYAKAKLWGFLYFNKWLIKRNINIGYNPLDKN